MQNDKLHSFSVIVAAFNEEKYIADCISSLRRQDYAGEFEIIVVDNGSSDNTSDIARNLGAQIISEPKKGVSHALIAGSKAAKGEILAFTDADTRTPEGWLSKLNKAFNSHQAVVGAGGPPYYYDGPKWADYVMHKIFVNIYIKFFHDREQALPGFNMAILADAYRKAGGFEPGYNWGQDWKMAKKAGQFGKVIFDRDIFVYTSFRRFHGNLSHPLLRNVRIAKEITVGLARMVPMVYFNKNLKAQKPIR